VVVPADAVPALVVVRGDEAPDRADVDWVLVPGPGQADEAQVPAPAVARRRRDAAAAYEYRSQSDARYAADVEWVG